MSFTVLVDTREQMPYWEPGKHTEHGIEFDVERATLKTGDYAAEGFEDRILVERKNGVDELAACVGRCRARFERELARMHDEAEQRLLVIESDAMAVFLGTYRSEVKPAAIFGSLAAWSWRYGIHVCWAGSRTLAREITLRALAAVVRDPECAKRQAPAGKVVA